MKEIFAMTPDEMAAEIRSHPFQKDRGYACISYAWADRATVWPAVLNLQRAGFNLYIDLDPDRRDDSRVRQIGHILARNACRMALCFRSRNWTCRLGTLLEILTMRSLDTTNRHLGDPLRVEYLVIEPAPLEPGVIPFDQLSAVQESYDYLHKAMGDRLCGDCPSERDALLAGLEDWLVDMPADLKTRMHYTRYSGRGIFSMLESTYEDGAVEFYPYINRLVSNWFETQGLTTPLSRSDLEGVLTQAGVWREGGPAQTQ